MPSFPTYQQLDSMDCGSTCLRIIAKDASAQPLQTYSGSFETTMPTGLENLTIDKKVGNKFIYGNKLYIHHNGHLHTATGARVK